ncbi:MAG: hypothetical protein ACI4QC_11560 [Thermoguttaceae bacterium]
MTEGTPKDSDAAELSANSGTRAPLSQYLQTDAEQEEGWTVVSSDESENRMERKTNVYVLKQIKRFLSEDVSPENSFISPEAKSASYHVDYPYYDGEMNAQPVGQNSNVELTQQNRSMEILEDASTQVPSDENKHGSQAVSAAPEDSSSKEKEFIKEVALTASGVDYSERRFENVRDEEPSVQVESATVPKDEVELNKFEHVKRYEEVAVESELEKGGINEKGEINADIPQTRAPFTVDLGYLAEDAFRRLESQGTSDQTPSSAVQDFEITNHSPFNLPDEGAKGTELHIAKGAPSCYARRDSEWNSRFAIFRKFADMLAGQKKEEERQRTPEESVPFEASPVKASEPIDNSKDNAEFNDYGETVAIAIAPCYDKLNLLNSIDSTVVTLE